MLRGTMKAILVLAVVLLGMGVPLMAGVVFEVETTDQTGEAPSSHEMYVQDGQLKMHIDAGKGARAGAGSEVIFHGDRREMVVVDHGEKSYMVIDEETIAQISGQVNSMMQQLEKQMEGMDPMQREMMEKMMKGQMGGMGAPKAEIKLPSMEFRKSSDRADKNGYPCVRYDVLRDGQKMQELWVTDWDNIEGGDEVLDVFKDMASFFSEMMEALPKMGGKKGGMFGADRSLMEAFKQVDGFPVVTRTFSAGGELENEAVLTSSSSRRLDPAEFEPPSGYKRRSMMGPQ